MTRMCIDFDWVTGTIAQGITGGQSTIYYPTGVTYLASGYNLAGYSTGRTAGSRAWGGNVNNVSQNTPQGILINLSSIGNLSEYWFTMDVMFVSSLSSTGVGNPTSTYFPTLGTIFKWGDLTVRVLTPTTIGLFNGATQVATVVHPGMVANQWYFVKIHAKLNSVTGLLDVTFDGQNANFSNLNTVATTPLANATTVSVTAGVYYSGSGANSCGKLDNVYIDDAGFPAGRPTFERASVASVAASNQFSASSGTIPDALNAAGGTTALGSSTGSSLSLNITNTASGVVGQLFGVLQWAVAVKKLDGLDRKLALGLELAGVENMGPDQLLLTDPGSSTLFQSLFAKPDGSPYSQADFAALHAKLKVSGV